MPPKRKRAARSKEYKANKRAKNEEARKEFRFAASRVFLTYSQSGETTREQIRDTIHSKHQIKDYWIGLELHRSGDKHIHAVIFFNNTVDSTDPAVFDIGELHPNISQIKSRDSEQRCMEYAIKDMNYICSGDMDLFTGSKNFHQRMNDHDGWVMSREARSGTPFPLTLPHGKVVDAPTAAEKKCNWYFVAPSNWGKSEWPETITGGVPFFAKGGDHMMEGYYGNQLIICDDFYPTLKQLIEVTGCSKWKKRAPGEQRYRSCWMKQNQRAMVVILKCDLPDYATDPKTKEAFDNRFHTVHLAGTLSNPVVVSTTDTAQPTLPQYLLPGTVPGADAKIHTLQCSQDHPSGGDPPLAALGPSSIPPDILPDSRPAYPRKKRKVL